MNKKYWFIFIIIVFLSACSPLQEAVNVFFPGAPAIKFSTVTSVPPNMTSESTPTPITMVGCVGPVSLRVRSEPTIDSSLLGGLAINKCVTVTGRNQDQSWGWVISEDMRGWVSLEYLTVDGNVSELPIKTEFGQPISSNIESALQSPTLKPTITPSKVPTRTLTPTTQTVYPTSTASMTPKPTKTPTTIPSPTLTSTTRPTREPTLTATSTPKRVTIPSPTPTPESITLEGSGDSLVNLDKSFDAAVAHIIGNSTGRHFSVESQDSNNAFIALLVNTTDPYDGVVPIDLDDRDNTAWFEITAYGSWSIEVIPLMTYAEESTLIVPGSISGSGDDIVYLSGSIPDLAIISGNQEADRFVIRSYGSSVDLLVNTTDPYKGTVLLDSDTYVLEIKAKGSWTIEITSP